MHYKDLQKTREESRSWNRFRQHSGLSLIQYRPPGSSKVRTCAAVWEDHEHVHLATPLVRKQAGIFDPQPFIKKFPFAVNMVDAFERAMEWLDAVCYAAKTTTQVRQACEDAPQWGLACTRYDATDQTLGMGGLGHTLLSDDALIREVAKQCLIQTIMMLLKEDPLLHLGHFDVIEDNQDAGYVATVGLPSGVCVRISMLKKVPRTEVIRFGILAMDRMKQPGADWQHALVVMPGLALERPMYLSKGVTISNLEFAMIRASLLALVPQES